MVEIYILTGASGAGKSTAQYVFEESGFYVMENVFPTTLKMTLDALKKHTGAVSKFLFITTPVFAEETIKIIKEYAKNDHNLKVKSIALTCNEAVLLQRFKLTRHVHPSTTYRHISLSDAVKEDIDTIGKISYVVDCLIDTSDMSAFNLRKALFSLVCDKEKDTVSLCFMSFGHKHSIPLDVDLILDTRALPNPYWVEELREYSGLEKPVVDYLEALPITKQTLDHMIAYLDFYLEQVQLDGRGNYTIGVCCSGGKHRSVYFADQLAKHYKDKYNVITIHRDIEKE